MQSDMPRRDILTDVKVLLIDTCGEVGQVGLCDGAALVAAAQLPAREASLALVDMIGAMLSENRWSFRDLNAVAVVAGPGSFTGVRVGMSAAKGLVEAGGLRLISLSRLAMLARASEAKVIAVFDAGRGEFYVRTEAGIELLMTKDALLEQAAGKRVLVAEAKTMAALQELKPEFVEMSLRFAVPLLLEEAKAESTDAALADANYVRREQDIYAKRAS